MPMRDRILSVLIVLVALATVSIGGAAWRLDAGNGGDLLPIDDTVTPETVQQTICVPGWTRERRPSSSVMRRIKLGLLASRGEPPERRTAYILDHLIPLQLGGASRDARNLELNLTADEKEKDRVENKLKCLVCNGRLDLRTAQRAIWYDWRAAVRNYAEVSCRRPRARRV